MLTPGPSATTATKRCGSKSTPRRPVGRKSWTLTLPSGNPSPISSPTSYFQFSQMALEQSFLHQIPALPARASDRHPRLAHPSPQNQQTHCARARSENRNYHNWPGLDSEFFALEKKLHETGLGRLPNEPLLHWRERLRRELPPVLNLDRTFNLHRRLRFDPNGLEPRRTPRIARRSHAIISRVRSHPPGRCRFRRQKKSLTVKNTVSECESHQLPSYNNASRV